ncbi:GNAT family N-acetyltransferase [Geothrix fermentans]|jgi:ribosomal protein S18 acetylase RimI-like enzyme|uniref:GNAT family N-acetyltransferase n=1 Tax=Geothrix fermentans TaxID=44676 RepID=UPI00040C7846|nr:GNAT family N-acetyltransferase [Geothrix fermentans]
MTIETLSPHPEGARYAVRPLGSADFAHLQRLEAEIWSGDGAGELCPHYLRLCTELYGDWCFLAMDGDRPVGYVLNFVKGATVYCATLAVHPEYQKGRVNYLLIRAMVAKLLQENVEECRFLVEPGNDDARSVHHALGARVVAEVHDYYAPGDTRLWSAITREDLERVRARYTRLKLVS